MVNCKHKGNGLTKVFSVGSCTVWAGGEAQAKSELSRMKVAVSLLGDLRTGMGFTLNDEGEQRLPALSKLSHEPAIVNVLWPDGGAPALGLEFWLALEQDLAFTKGDAVIFCLAGHGRTGTALTILAALAGVTKDQDPVLWVRNHYCRHVVETWKQVDYLEDLGIPTIVIPSYAISRGSDQTKKGHKTTSEGYQGWPHQAASKAAGGFQPLDLDKR